MKRITERYEQKCNYVMCTKEEFKILKDSFLLVGYRLEQLKYAEMKLLFK